MDGQLDRFGHLNKFQHLSDPDIDNPEGADLGYKYLSEDLDYPTLVLYVSVKRKPNDLVTLKYGLIRDHWKEFTQASEEDAEELLSRAKPEISRNLQSLKEGHTPPSSDFIQIL